MASFFEKLKKGMGIEIPAEGEARQERPEEVEEKPRPVRRKKQSRKLVVNAKPVELIIESEESKVKEELKVKEEVKKPSLAPPVTKVMEDKKVSEGKEKWFEPEGQLAIDVYQTEECLVIQSAIAGVKPENLDISIEEDQVLIKGSREKPSEEEEKNYFYQECYWGSFSRQIILPEETDPSRAEAILKEGILTIRIPKIERKKKRKIVVKGNS